MGIHIAIRAYTNVGTTYWHGNTIGNFRNNNMTNTTADPAYGVKVKLSLCSIN
jgi:hypothetical protein